MVGLTGCEGVKRVSDPPSVTADLLAGLQKQQPWDSVGTQPPHIR